MQFTGFGVQLPEDLVRDFASDPLASLDKLLRKANDPGWSLYPDLSRFLSSLPIEAVEAAFEDRTFVALYGKDERLARIWVADQLLVNETARRRLEVLAGTSSAETMPYAADCLRGIAVDSEGMVQLDSFTYNRSTLDANGFSFTICTTTPSPNSTYWLLRSFYEQDVANHVSVRLDPFLWGPSDSFPQMMYKMIVYAKPLAWDGIGRLREQHSEQMRADMPWDKGQVTEFYWNPRSDGIHFICEEIPPKDRIAFAGARYLHAIYDPDSQLITHFDGAMRIYNDQQFEERQKDHLRKLGKTGVRKKIFRIDEPIDRDAFSLIAQAFFVWNSDLATYFRDTLAANDSALSDGSIARAE
jgi:hypothetical protein